METAMENQEVEKKTFWIPESNRTALEAQLAKLSKKALKLKMAPIELVILGEEIRQEPVLDSYGEFRYDAEGKKITKPRRWLNVEPRGEQPKIAGWTLLAAIDHLEGGNNLREAPGVKGLPKVYRKTKPFCDHCQVTRRRLSTMVLQKVDGGEYKQVGRQCLRDFLGHENPEAVVAYFELLRSAMGAAQGAEEDEGGYGYGGGVRYLEATAEYLAVVAAVIRIEGSFISRGMSRDRGGRSTADTAYAHLNPPTGSSPAVVEERKYLTQFAPTDDDKALAEQSIAWARTISDDEESDYLWNCKLAASGDYLTIKQLGVAASIVQAYLREQGKAAERKARAEAGARSQHFGAVGKRETFKLTVTKKIAVDSQWGTMTIHKFVDESGNIATWFASRGAELTEGQTYTIKATVKEHKEYQGAAETVLTRCNVIESSQPTAQA
jgi:hypothetical protein